MVDIELCEHASTEDSKTTTCGQGNVQLRDPIKSELVLIPRPSGDPKDPLNWPRKFRILIAFITSAAVFLAQFLAAGPSVDMIKIVFDLFGTTPNKPEYPSAVAKASYFFSGVAFLHGMSNLLYMPLIIKYGRRPVYIVSFLVYGGCSLWAGLAKTYASELAARLFLGFAGASADCLGPLTITDIFFLHERGLIMSFYSTAVSCGIGSGIVLSGLISIHHSWRDIYFIASAMIWALLIIIVIFMPETAYKRSSHRQAIDTEPRSPSPPTQIYRVSYQNKQLFNFPYTEESLWQLFWRPIPVLFLPCVLWGTLAQSVSVSALVAITTNSARAFSTTYGWSAWQCGLVYIATMIGAIISIFGGGWLSDATADWLTRRNQGIREPEMRLPALAVSTVWCPLSLLLYGFGISHGFHWIVPAVGLGLLGFSISQIVNISVLYAVESHRPISGEVVVSQLSFKGAFGFLLSFYTNPWIDSAGYKTCFSILAGINAMVLLMWIPLYIWGKDVRAWYMQLDIARVIQWKSDREVGE